MKVLYSRFVHSKNRAQSTISGPFCVLTVKLFPQSNSSSPHAWLIWEDHRQSARHQKQVLRKYMKNMPLCDTASFFEENQESFMTNLQKNTYVERWVSVYFLSIPKNLSFFFILHIFQAKVVNIGINPKNAKPADAQRLHACLAALNI